MAILLAGLSAPAPAQVPPRAADFVAAVQANGCALTEAQAADRFPALGLSMADAQAAAAILSRGRLFTVDDDGVTLRLVPDLCAADAAGVQAALAAAALEPEPGAELLDLGARIDPARGAVFLGAVRANGCTMTEAQAEATLPALGFTQDQVQDLAGLLIVTGRAGLEGEALVLPPDLCAASPDGDAALIQAAIADFAAATDPGPLDAPLVRAALAELAAVNGCIVDADPPILTGQLADWLGLGADTAALAPLVAEVLATPAPEFIQDGATLRLTDCPN